MMVSQDSAQQYTAREKSIAVDLDHSKIAKSTRYGYLMMHGFHQLTKILLIGPKWNLSKHQIRNSACASH